MRSDALWAGGILAVAGIAVAAILLRKPAPAPAPAGGTDLPPLAEEAPARTPAPFDPYARMPDPPELPAPAPASLPATHAFPAPVLQAPASVPTVLRSLSAKDGVKLQPGDHPDAPVLVVDPFPEDGPVPMGKAGRQPKAPGKKAKEAVKTREKAKAGTGVPAQGG